MTLQEQIAEFEAKGCVAGGRKWEKYYDSNSIIEYKITIGGFSVFVKIVQKSLNPQDLTFNILYYNQNVHWGVLTSTTLEPALIEALEIVKAKVMDLAKELGFVCLNEHPFGIIEALEYAKQHNKLNIANSELANSNIRKYSDWQISIRQSTTSTIHSGARQ